MKVCTRFHFEDVERGDRLFLGYGRVQEFNDTKDPDVEIVVRSAYTTRNFGPVIVADDGETYYLYDYDVIHQVQEDVA